MRSRDSTLNYVQWISRDENEVADAISKMIDVEDWQISYDFFDYLSNIWGPFSIDRFSNQYNTKLERFNSKFYVPGYQRQKELMLLCKSGVEKIIYSSLLLKKS